MIRGSEVFICEVVTGSEIIQCVHGLLGRQVRGVSPLYELAPSEFFRIVEDV